MKGVVLQAQGERRGIRGLDLCDAGESMYSRHTYRGTLAPKNLYRGRVLSALAVVLVTA